VFCGAASALRQSAYVACRALHGLAFYAARCPLCSASCTAVRQGKHQARHQAILLLVARRFVIGTGRLALLMLYIVARQAGQRLQRFGVVANHRVCVAVHRQTDGAMPRQRLRHLRMDATGRKVRNERVPQRVEVGHASRTVFAGYLGVGQIAASASPPSWCLAACRTPVCPACFAGRRRQPGSLCAAAIIPAAPARQSPSGISRHPLASRPAR